MTTGELVEVSIIGHVRARVDGQPVHIPRGRPRILLAALALEAGRPRSVTRLMDYLWGEKLPENPRASLQNLIRRLRQLIGPTAIRTHTEGYQLDIPTRHIDVHQFLHLADQLTSTPLTNTRQRHTLITTMQQLWQDDPLADIGSTTLTREYTPALFERYLAMVEARADTDIATGHRTRAIGDLRELTARHPLHESLWARLLHVLRDTGRVAEALDTYEHLRSTLADELGADPSPALQHIHHQLLTINTGADTRTHAEAQPSKVEPAAEHATDPRQSAKSGPDPNTERSAEQVADATPPADAGQAGHTAEAAEPEAEYEPPRQLLPEPAGFVGRLAETAKLDAVLEGCSGGISGADERTGEHRGTRTGGQVTPGAAGRTCLAVLHGPGGIGKTALAIRWAHRVAWDFPGGQLYLDLQGFGPGAPLEPHLALGILLRSLGVPPEQVPVRTVERSSLLRTRTAGRRILVVLDNAHDEQQVRPLLPGSGAMVLITSRNRLRDLGIREGATGIALTELRPDEARTLIGSVLGASRPRTDGHNVDDLIDLCGGLPLALRIAAEMCSRYPGVPLPDLVGDLAKPADTPGSLNDGLRTVFSWSYQRLDQFAATLFRRIGRFPGRTFGIDTAAVLLDADRRQTATQLQTLVDLHLLDEPERGRFALHDLTRAYAAGCFAEEEDPEQQHNTESRILDWYLHATATAGNALGHSAPFELTSGIGQPTHPVPRFESRSAGSRWLEAELPTILELVEDAAEHGYHEHTWQFARALLDFLLASPYVDEWVRLNELALAAARETGDPWAIREASHSLGMSLNDAGRHDESEAALRVSLAVARDHGHPGWAAIALSGLGMVREESGDCAGSAAYHDEAIETARAADRQATLAHTLMNSGGSAISCGDLDRGIAHSTRALRWYVESDDHPLQQAIVLGNLAYAHLQRDELESAKEHGEAALRILDGLGDRRYSSSVLIDLGKVYARTGRLEAAAQSWQRARAKIPPRHHRTDELRAALASLGEGASNRDGDRTDT